MPSRNARC